MDDEARLEVEKHQNQDGCEWKCRENGKKLHLLSRHIRIDGKNQYRSTFSTVIGSQKTWFSFKTMTGNSEIKPVRWKQSFEQYCIQYQLESSFWIT